MNIFLSPELPKSWRTGYFIIVIKFLIFNVLGHSFTLQPEFFCTWKQLRRNAYEAISLLLVFIFNSEIGTPINVKLSFYTEHKICMADFLAHHYIKLKTGVSHLIRRITTSGRINIVKLFRHLGLNNLINDVSYALDTLIYH